MIGITLKAFRWLGACSMLCAAAYAADINVGFVSFDVTFPPNVGAVDIQNLTGPNSSPAPATDFPITTPLSLTNLSLVVDFSGGFSEAFGPSSGYFTKSADGLSFDGQASFNESTSPVVLATLTGTFGTTSLTLNDGSHVTISSDFTAKITDSSGLLANGDFALITATTGGPPPTVPEPASWLLLGSGLALVLGAGLRKRFSSRNVQKALLMGLACLFVAVNARAATSVTLATWTVPSSGVSGTNNVWVTGSNFPIGTIHPANVTVSLATSCGATSGASSETATAVTNIVGGVDRVEFLIPAGLATGKYFVSLKGTSSGGTAFASSTCAAVNVTHGSTALSACNPGSSMGIISPNKLPSGTTPVTAYVPNGNWAITAVDGVRVVPLEGSGTVGAVSTTKVVNSCSSNSVTGETVCTSNGTDVYLITGKTLNKTLTSGATNFMGFSGGSCETCGVAVNSVANQAVIQIGVSGGSGIQFIDLKTNTVGTPVPATTRVSEDILWDPFRNFVLSPNELSNYEIFKVTGSGLPGPSNATEFGNPVTSPSLELDSAGEDCTTGIALAGGEGTGDLFLANLTQASFTAGSPGTWTAPSQTQHVTEFDGLAAGASAIAVAPGSTHLGVVAGEFGGSLLGVVQLPTKAGTGVPALVDWVAATLPTDPAGRGFSNGYDPHTTTAYTSPNNGKAYGVAADWSSGSPDYVAIIDLQAMLNAPRTSGTHFVDPAYDLLAHGVVRFVKTF